MLKQLRQKKTMKRILWALAILIIPPFVFWGGGSMLKTRGKGPDCAGIIFGKKVSFEDYAKAWQATKNQVMMMYGSKLDEISESLRLEEQAWDRLILLREAQKKGIRASDNEVIQTIQSFPFFQSRGMFDKKAYDLILLQVFKTDPRQFEEEIRESIIIAKLRNSVISGVKITDDEVKEEYAKENEKSKIAYILFPPNDFKKDLKIDEAASKKYYDDNAESFRIPDQVNVEYLGFEFADYQKNLQVSDEEVQKYYNEHKDEFDPKKEFKDLKEPIKNMLLGQKAKEKALYSAEKIDYFLADKSKTLEDAAKESSMAIKETGFFGRDGPIPQIGWFPEIQKTAFTLKPGERSELMKSRTGFANGYYIIRLKDKRPSSIPPFEEIKGKIESALIEKEARQIALAKANETRDKIAAAIKQNTVGQATFENAAAAQGAAVKSSESFARNGYIQGLGTANQLGEAAFKKEGGGIPPVAEMPAGICIFSVVEITPVDEEKFKAEKGEFAKKALEAKKSAVLNEWYTDLIARANLKNNIPSQEM